jgi:hypothetical protein
MDYKSGTVFSRIEHATAAIGFYCLATRQYAVDSTKMALVEGFHKDAEDGRDYLRSLLFETETDDRRAKWLREINNRISAINMVRAEDGRSGRIEKMEVMLRNFVYNWPESHQWDTWQGFCSELGTVSRYIENKIREEIREAVEPYQALLK